LHCAISFHVKPELWRLQTRVHECISAQYRSEMCMIVARQYAAQGIWDVANLQHSNDIGPGVDVQATVEKVMHARKMCQDVSTNFPTLDEHIANRRHLSGVRR
jgi:hypothetical protein